jgi:putative transposase
VQPRPAYPGTTYLITRRCSERRFFLQPSELVFQVFLFVLAVAANTFGIQVHAVCVLGNHYHAVITDPKGDVSAFYHYLHEFVSKCLNASRGRWENMWSIEETNRVSLETLEAIEEKVGYTLCNPVSSELVSHAKDWPGMRLWWGEGKRKWTIKRPEVFFSAKGKVAAEATLELVPPPALAAAYEDGGVEVMTKHLRELEEKLRQEARKAGRRFLGVKAIRQQKWSECPDSFAKRRGLKPRVATRNKWKRIEALLRNLEFVAQYREARKKWLEGDRDVVFPFGTYLMRVVHRVRCAGPPAAAAPA